VSVVGCTNCIERVDHGGPLGLPHESVYILVTSWHAPHALRAPVLSNLSCLSITLPVLELLGAGVP
jgi:hypothetical protein